MTFLDLTRQVRRTLISPCWSGNVNEGRAYAAWCLNVERLIPWRTLTGRDGVRLELLPQTDAVLRRQVAAIPRRR